MNSYQQVGMFMAFVCLLLITSLGSCSTNEKLDKIFKKQISIDARVAKQNQILDKILKHLPKLKARLQKQKMFYTAGGVKQEVLRQIRIYKGSRKRLAQKSQPPKKQKSTKPISDPLKKPQF